MSHATQHNSTASPQLVFDPLRMLAGDVVLERAHGKESEAILRVDGGSFCHALIWTGGTDFIEAIDGGSRTISFARVGVDDPTRWALLRFTGAGSDSAQLAAQAALAARNQVYKPYNMKGAVRSVTPFPALSKTDLFCSELVAVAYAAVGVAIVDGCPPQKTTPRVLETSSKFTAVRPLPLIKGHPPSGDRGDAYADSGMNKENQLAQAVFREVIAVYGTALAESARQGGYPLGNFSDLTNLFSACPDEVGRPASNLAQDRLRAGGYYNFIPQETRREMLARAHLADTIAIHGWRDSLARHRMNANACLAIAHHRPWPFWRAQVELYEDLATFFAELVAKAIEAAPASGAIRSCLDSDR